MASEPHGRTLDVDYMFTKLCVNDIERAAKFYESVCGLVEIRRMDAHMMGDPVTEIVYRATYPEGPMLILAKFTEAPAPATDEVILGFAVKDLEAMLERVEKGGGRILEPIQESPGFAMRHAFVADPEGHRIQLSSVVG